MGRRDTLLLSILTLVTSLAWIAFDVYHASVDTTIAPDVEQRLVPITPRFDRQLLQKINQRENVDPLESEDILSNESNELIQPQATGTAVRQSQSGGP